MAATARTCPLHALPLEETDSAVGIILACPVRTCSYAVMPPPDHAPRQPALPGLKRGTGRSTPEPTPTEHVEQTRLFDRIRAAEQAYPALSMVYAVPNGGFRHIATAKAMRDEGVRAGVPDVHIPLARKGYCGGWIEMKRRGNGPTDGQREYAAKLLAEGHWYELHYTAETAWPALCGYLGIPAS